MSVKKNEKRERGRNLEKLERLEDFQGMKK